MNKKEIKTKLEECLKLYKKSEIALDHLERCFGYNVVSSVVGNAIFQNFDAYTKVLSEQLNSSDWLVWYIYDNDCGEKGLEASVGKKKMKKICTLDDLVELIMVGKNE